MINTFQPYIKIVKRFKNTHDWFSVGFYISNYIQFNISVLGYGFIIGAMIFDVMKLNREKNDKLV